MLFYLQTNKHARLLSGDICLAFFFCTWTDFEYNVQHVQFSSSLLFPTHLLTGSWIDQPACSTLRAAQHTVEIWEVSASAPLPPLQATDAHKGISMLHTKCLSDPPTPFWRRNWGASVVALTNVQSWRKHFICHDSTRCSNQCISSKRPSVHRSAEMLTCILAEGFPYQKNRLCLFCPNAPYKTQIMR